MIGSFRRHAGLEEPAPYLIRGHPDVVPTPYPVRGKLQSGTIPLELAPGFHRESWIPAGVYPDENRGRNDETACNVNKSSIKIRMEDHFSDGYGLRRQ